MRNKLVAVIVAALLAVAFASTAFAGTFSDVPDSHQYANAINRLADLGILEGVGGGKYDPESTYTRAQFAALTTKLLGLKSAADASKGATNFSDVPADHWASGFINVASSQGIVKGMGDGTFHPDDPVTHAQALTMLVRALGYEPVLKGTWPANVLAKAAELGLFSGVNVVANLPASRAEVAQFASNAVDTPMLIQTGYGADAKYCVSGTSGCDPKKTLLTGAIGDQVEGQVTASVESVDSTVKANEITLKPSSGSSKTYKVASSVNVVGLLGKTIKAAIRSIGSDDVIVGISDTDDEDFESKIVRNINSNATQMTLCDKYDPVDDKWDGCNTRNIASSPSIWFNNAKVTTLSDLGNKGSASIRAKVKLNDSNEVEVAVIQEWTGGKLASGVNASAKRIDTEIGSREDLSDYTVFVVRNGKAASLSDIAANDVFYVRKDDTRDRAVVYAFGNSVAGKFGGANSKTDLKRVFIDGKGYNLVPTHYVSTNDGDDYDKAVSDVDANANVTAYLDAVGRVFALRTGTAAVTAKNYALAYKVRQNSELAPDYALISLVNASGSRVEYRVNDDTKINGSTYAVEEKADASDTVADALFANGNYTDGTDSNRTNVAKKYYLVDYELASDGVTLDEINVVEQGGSPITSGMINTNNALDFDDTNDRVDGVKVDTAMPVFDTKGVLTNSPSDVKVRTWAAVKKASDPKGGYYIDGRVKVVLLADYTALEGAVDRSAVVAKPQWTGSSNYKLVVNTKGNEKTYEAKSSDWDVVIKGHATCTSISPCNMETVAGNGYMAIGDVVEIEQSGSNIDVTVLDPKAALSGVSGADSYAEHEVKSHKKSDEKITLYINRDDLTKTKDYYYDAQDVLVYDARNDVVKLATLDDFGNGDWVKIYTDSKGIVEVIVIVDQP